MMAKTYKVLVNDGKGAENNVVQVLQGSGDKGGAVRLVAQRGARYELQDVTKGKGYAPDQVRIKRVGNNLTLMFDGSQAPDVVVEDYYSPSLKGEGATPVLAGLAENGSVYEYIPQDPNANHLTPSLKDGNTPVLMALGGGALGEGFVLSGLPVVAAAAGGVSGWMIGAGLLGAAALGGGGGGGGGSPGDTTPPIAGVGTLKHDVSNDTGVSDKDGITNNKKPVLVVTAESGAKVEVLINGKTYLGTETTTKGSYEVQVTDELPDGTYTPQVVVTDSAGNKNSSGKCDAFTLDTSRDQNVANGSEVDLNVGADTQVLIKAVSQDTGTLNNDFITSARNVKISGIVKEFHDTGISADDSVLVNVFDASAKLVGQEYVHPDINGEWMMASPTDALVDGTYNVKASIVDAAGNVIKSSADQPLVISQTYFASVNDAVTVQEDQTPYYDATKNNVLFNEVDTVSLSATVSSIQLGSLTKVVNAGSTYINGTQLKGLYGTLTIGADGSYLYAVDTSNSSVQSLSTSNELRETFSYVAVNNKNISSAANLVVAIKGANDVAKIVVSDTDIDVSSLILPVVGKVAIAVEDVDTGENQLKDASLTSSTEINSLGVLKLEPTLINDVYEYKWSYSNTQSITSNAEVHDLFVLQSKDGYSSETLNFQLTKITGASKEFHASTLVNLAAVGGNNVTDSLVLHGKSMNFDFSNPRSSDAAEVAHIEKIDITGSGTNTIKLTLASIVQADLDNGIHKLYITGDAGDAVELAKPNTTWIASEHLTTRNVSNVTYKVYEIDAAHELLIHNAINTITVS
jgi:VCBS repeat-containing protein